MHEVKLRGCVFYFIHFCNNNCFRSANSVETGKKYYIATQKPSSLIRQHLYNI